VRDSVGRLFVVPRASYPLLLEDRELVRRLYAGAVRQMDDFLARVVDTLTATSQLARTTVILTSDHGEELLEHGHVGHASTSHYATLYEEVLRVPLLFIDSRMAAQTLTARVQGQDLFPTLLRLAGEDPRLPAASPAVDLSGLLFTPAAVLPDALAADRVLTFQSARMGYQTPRSHATQVVSGFSDGRKKYIFEQYETPRRLLYDLQADPGEQAPILDGEAIEQAHERLLATLSG
jgi:arylsulfatase A-like enzyme